ncbi:MAG: asparagine synthase-related protein, partial [Holophagales bacterium]|nr:asparagine synthase-related protein [Holophagales bacterium]
PIYIARIVNESGRQRMRVHRMALLLERLAEDPGAPSADERSFMKPVEMLVDRPCHHLDERELPLLDGFDDGTPYESPSHLSTFQSRYRRLAELMKSSGSRILLSGVGGDNVVWGEFRVPPQLADLAAAGSWRRLLAEMRRWQPALRLSYGKILWQGVMQPLWPALRDRGWESESWHVPWMHPDFVRRHGLRPGRLLGAGEPDMARPSQRAQLRMIREAAHWQVDLSYLEGELLGAERCYPFLDRRLVELCLAVPAEQFARPGETRSLHRRALRHVLPPEIAARRGKSSPEEALIRAFGRQWPKLADLFRGDALVYQRGYVDRGPFLRALEQKRFGLVKGGSVQNVVELEMWLRGLDRRLLSAAA